MALKKQQKRSIEEPHSGLVENVAANKSQKLFKKMKTDKPVQTHVLSNGIQGKKTIQFEKQKSIVQQPIKVNNGNSTVEVAAKIMAKKIKKVEKQMKKKANRKEVRQEQGQYKPEQGTISPEAIELRVKEIESRPELTKTARRRLRILKKKLQIARGTYVPKSQPVKSSPEVTKNMKRQLRKKNQAEKQNVEKISTDSMVSAKTQTVEKANKKGAALVKQGQNAKRLIVQKEEPEDSEDKDDEEDEVSDEEAEDSNESLNTTEEQDDDDDDEDDEEGDDEEEDEDDDEEKDEEEKEVKVPIKKVKQEQQKKQPVKMDFEKVPVHKDDAGKKKRFVLFVGNLSYDASPEEIKKHFLTKVSAVSSVRVPSKPGTNTPRGFAYVELENDTDYEKGLSLHNTTLNGRRINVEYTRGGSKSVDNRQDVVSKNKKLHAMRKQGMLAGSQKNGHKRNDRRQKQRQQGPA